MCFSQPKIQQPAPTAPAPAEPLKMAAVAKTQRQAQPQQKRRRGTAQLTRSVRRPTLSMGGGTAGTGVQLSQ